VPGFRIDRTGMAIVGAAAAVATGAIAWDRAVAAVDAHTLILLFGMMVVGAYLRLSGFFALVTRQTVRLARTPVALRTNLHQPPVLIAVMAALSNVVSNVPAVLLLKPVVTTLGEPQCAWLLVAMASTLAGNLTLIGSVANLIVVEAAREARIDIGFMEYARVGVRLTLATLLLGWALLR
jgi:Na+/H+ antiporter NhaD/arsenite permease-like protein